MINLSSWFIAITVANLSLIMDILIMIVVNITIRTMSILHIIDRVVAVAVAAATGEGGEA